MYVVHMRVNFALCQLCIDIIKFPFYPVHTAVKLREILRDTETNIQCIELREIESNMLTICHLILMAFLSYPLSRRDDMRTIVTDNIQHEKRKKTSKPICSS